MRHILLGLFLILVCVGSFEKAKAQIGYDVGSSKEMIDKSLEQLQLTSCQNIYDFLRSEAMRAPSQDSIAVEATLVKDWQSGLCFFQGTPLTSFVMGPSIYFQGVLPPAFNEPPQTLGDTAVSPQGTLVVNYLISDPDLFTSFDSFQFKVQSLINPMSYSYHKIYFRKVHCLDDNTCVEETVATNPPSEQQPPVGPVVSGGGLVSGKDITQLDPSIFGNVSPAGPGEPPGGGEPPDEPPAGPDLPPEPDEPPCPGDMDCSVTPPEFPGGGSGGGQGLTPNEVLPISAGCSSINPYVSQNHLVSGFGWFILSLVLLTAVRYRSVKK